MIAVFRGYAGKVIDIKDEKLFYTLDPAAKEYLWSSVLAGDIEVPKDAYCWWLCSEDDVIYYDGRRRMI